MCTVFKLNMLKFQTVKVYNGAMKGVAGKQFQVVGKYVQWKGNKELHVSQLLQYEDDQ